MPTARVATWNAPVAQDAPNNVVERNTIIVTVT
jgi:hypothetical protein